MSHIDFTQFIRTIPNYPAEGIMFRDVTTLMGDAEGFSASIFGLKAWAQSLEFNVIAGIEARGFIFGSALALEMRKSFIPIRKKGKLPGDIISQSYSLEYGTDEIEIHQDALNGSDRVLIIDDLIATGGTAIAALELIKRAGAAPIGAGFVVDLPDLGGMQEISEVHGVPCHALCEFEGD